MTSDATFMDFDMTVEGSKCKNRILVIVVTYRLLNRRNGPVTLQPCPSWFSTHFAFFLMLEVKAT